VRQPECSIRRRSVRSANRSARCAEGVLRPPTRLLDRPMCLCEGRSGIAANEDGSSSVTILNRFLPKPFTIKLIIRAFEFKSCLSTLKTRFTGAYVWLGQSDLPSQHAAETG